MVKFFSSLVRLWPHFKVEFKELESRMCYFDCPFCGVGLHWSITQTRSRSSIWACPWHLDRCKLLLLAIHMCLYIHAARGVCTRRKLTCEHLCLRVLSQCIRKEKANSPWNKQQEQRQEASLLLILSLAADVPHKSIPLHPGCFHGDGARNRASPLGSARCAPRVPPPALLLSLQPREG